MLKNYDEQLRQIADDFAEPEKKGELLKVLKLLKNQVIKDTLDHMVHGVQSIKNDIDFRHLDKGIIQEESDYKQSNSEEKTQE